MAYGDSAFGFGDPNQMALLGALAGLSQYAGASRLPQTFGQAIGGAAGGLMAGIGQGQKYQLNQEQVMSEQLKNTVALDLLRSQAAAMGAQVPTAEDIKKGYTIDWPEIFKKAYGGQSGAAPQLPTTGAQSQMPAPQQSEAAPPGAAGQELAGNTNLDSLTEAIHQLESGGRTDGVPDSKAGAIGPMQIMPQTAAGYLHVSPAEAEALLRQSDVNRSLGKHIVSDLYQKYGGDPEAVAVAYNGGPGRADNWLAAGRDNSVLPKETQNYLAGLRDKLPQYAQNNVAAASFTDASPSFTDASGAPAAAPTILPEMNRMDAFRQLTLAQRMGNIPPAAQQYLQAQLVPSGAARNIAVASALKAAGIPLSIGGERPGVPQRVFAGFNAQGQPVYTIASQNPKSETGQLIGPNGELYYPKGTLSTIAQGTSTKKWAGVPAEMFQKGIAVQPGGGSVAPVPGYPQTQAATAGTTAEAVKAGEYAAQFGNLIPGAASPGAAAGSQPGAEAAAAPPAAGTRLGIDPGSGKAFTSNIPPVSTQVLPQSPAEAEASQKDWQTRKNEFADAVDPAQQAEERMLTQASIYKMIETGAWKENKAVLAARLKSIGISPELLKLDDPAAVETALHENYQGTLNYLKTVNNRFTQREFATLSEYNPNPNLQPAANQQLLAEGIAILRRDQALAKDWEVAQKHGWRNPVSFETQYMTANPIAPIVNSVAHEIGPLKGMAPNATTSGAPYSPTGAGPAQAKPAQAEPAPKSAAPSAAPGATRSITIGGTTYHKFGNQWFPEEK